MKHIYACVTYPSNRCKSQSVLIMQHQLYKNVTLEPFFFNKGCYRRERKKERKLESIVDGEYQ